MLACQVVFSWPLVGGFGAGPVGSIARGRLDRFTWWVVAKLAVNLRVQFMRIELSYVRSSVFEYLMRCVCLGRR